MIDYGFYHYSERRDKTVIGGEQNASVCPRERRLEEVFSFGGLVCVLHFSNRAASACDDLNACALHHLSNAAVIP